MCFFLFLHTHSILHFFLSLLYSLSTFFKAVIIIDSFPCARNWVQKHRVTWLRWSIENQVFCPWGHAVQLWSEINAEHEQNLRLSHAFWSFEKQDEMTWGKKIEENQQKQIILLCCREFIENVRNQRGKRIFVSIVSHVWDSDL